MIKAWLLRLHRWLALLFSLPLLVLIVTGLILSFEPIAQTAALSPGTLSAAGIEALLAQHDPGGQTRAITFAPYENRLTLQGVGPTGRTVVDVASGAAVDPGRASGLFLQSRIIHEHLFDYDRLVTGSTVAMLALIAVGIFMGWPRIRNSLGGWHQAVAWFGLPLLILSPLTGLLLDYRVSFGQAGGSPVGPKPTLVEAVRAVGREKDLSGLVWLRQRGEMYARLNEGGRLTVYAVGRDGIASTGDNWVRLLHEGNYAGIASGLLNVLISVALLMLLVTGVLIWARRKLRRRRPRPAGRAVPV